MRMIFWSMQDALLQGEHRAEFKYWIKRRGLLTVFCNSLIITLAIFVAWLAKYVNLKMIKSRKYNKN